MAAEFNHVSLILGAGKASIMFQDSETGAQAARL